MLTWKTIAAGTPSQVRAYADHVFEKTLPDDHMRMADYYAGRHDFDLSDGSIPVVRADTDIALAEVLGITPDRTLDRQAFTNVLSGHKADGSDIPGIHANVRTYEDKDGTVRHKISAMDFCFSAPKSVSVAWAFAATDAERNSILQAHRDAVNDALKYAESVLAKGRMGNGGSKGTEQAKMTWMRIDHFTARPTVAFKRADPETGVTGTEVFTVSQKLAGDPDLHSHCIIPNYLVTASGRFTAIPKDLMRGRRLEFGAVYSAFLAKHLRAIGCDVALHSDNHMAHIPAIPEAVCDEFSKRNKDAHEAARNEAARRGLDWDQMTDQTKIDFLKGGAKASRRSKSDDLANIAAWHQQAEAIGWKHETVITSQPQTGGDRIRTAYETALPLMADRLQKYATLFAGEARIQAARGLIAAGIETPADIDAVVEMMANKGVAQDGKKTPMYARPDANGQMKLTTALHLDQEEELIALARAAHEDRSRALTAAEMAKAEAATGLTLIDEQRQALTTLGSGGAFGVFVGAAGVGKTASVLAALSAAYKARGYTVWGTALAWRQANALEEAGIDRLNCRALQPLLDGIRDRRTKLGRNHVVIIDELSQVSTKQLLDLLLMQAKYGFQIIATGDDRQCASIDAGAVIDLLRKALGKDAIPEILTTLRQKTEREREITGLFRNNQVDRAISMKREDGECIAVDGSYQDTVEAIADMALAKSATVSAPTNKDALEIGRAIRRKRGIADVMAVSACDQTGNEYRLALGKGDRVRLFARTRAQFGNHTAIIGNNGSVLEVVDVTDAGLKLRSSTGKLGLVPWAALRDAANGRIKLTYGECLTVEAAQGITSDCHLACMPSGSAAVEGFRNYVAQSRHRKECILMTSKAAEIAEIQSRRPMGVRPDVSEDEVWKNVVRNLSRLMPKENASDLLDQTIEARDNAVRNFQAGCRAREWAQHKGRPPSMLRINTALQKAGQSLRPKAAPSRKPIPASAPRHIPPP